jgi:TusE/DsrC/DsvC family sulfur relay protein
MGYDDVRTRNLADRVASDVGSMTTALSISSWHISPLSVGRHKPVSAPLDKEGYLVDLNDWSESVATELAARTGLELTQEHWQIITILRDFYRTTGVSPTMRPLVKLVRDRLGQTSATACICTACFR